MRSYQKIGGTLILFGTAQFLLLFHIAEELYPGYSTSLNAISDLGATCGSGSCVIIQPSSTIFNSTVFILGLTLFISSYCLYRSIGKRVFSVLFGLAGIGAMGVGLFTETTGSLHTIVSAITFLFGGLSAIMSYQIMKSSLRYFSVMMGVTTLSALILYSYKTYLGLGLGGMERMIAFPVLFWGLAFAGFLLTQTSDAKGPSVAT
ncbi:MAG: DUF998 domain-containing protein [Nitrososphaerales archaeon]